MNVRFVLLLLMVAAVPVFRQTAWAQEFPVKPVRIVVPFPAGGSFDITARMLAQRMQLGQSVLIENRPGGGTVIGTEFVVRAPGDGHTVLMIGPSFTMLSALRSKLPFDPEKDFKAMGQAIALPMVIKSDGLRYGKIARGERPPGLRYAA